jgi:flavin reductase (DIM6/NTAB) family NADH-FMN oxidoreductase RutF
MKHLKKSEIIDLPRLERMNLINSCGGIKSANLLGSCNKNGQTNLAIFNSVIHLGSNPPQLTFTLRPTTVERHTYTNLKETGVFTINHIHQGIIAQAHQTSASYDASESEFDKVGLTTVYKFDFKAPFVNESKIQMACSYENEYLIKENGCIVIVANIEHIIFDEAIQTEDGFLDLTKAESVGIIGLDAYVKTEMLNRFSYARPKEELKSIL